jgi:hypothetical protein
MDRALPPQVKKRRAQVFLGGLIVLFGLEIFMPLMCADRVVDARAFANAALAVAPELQRGDALLIHPPWRHDALDAIDEVAAKLPHGIKPTLVLPKGAGTRGRVVVLEDPAWPWPQTLKRLESLIVPRNAEGIRTHLLGPGAQKRPSEGPLSDAIHLAQVQVEKSDGQVVKCQWDASQNRHVCPGLQGWMYVGPHTQHSGGQSRPCLWAHPISGGKVKVAFAPRQYSGPLSFFHAVSDQAAQNRDGAEVTSTIHVDGEEVIRAVRTNRAGFATQRIPMPTQKAVSVEVEITTPHDGSRHYCFDLAPEGQAAGKTP